MSDDVEFFPFTEEIALVPLWESGDGTVTERGTPVDLDAAELEAELLAELADSTVRLAVPEDLDPASWEVLDELPIPGCFATSGWLSEHRPLVFRDAQVSFGGLRIEHHPEHGLLVREDGLLDQRW